MAANPPSSAQGTPFGKSRKIGQAITHEISIVNKFPLTYRNREDITNLPPGVLVVGSQNILSNVSERLEVRKGYKMDGFQLLYIQTTIIASNQVTVADTTSLVTGDKVNVIFTSSSITGLTSGSAYYLIVVDSTHVKFATTAANAIAGTAITISGTPTGASIRLIQSSVNASIPRSFDWNSKNNSEIHMRAGFLTSAANDGRMQFRWKDANSNVFWSDLLTGLTTVDYNFTTFWNSTELIRVSLFVNGTSNIFEWNGAYDTVVSTTANTITVTNSIATTGFYSSTNRTITIRGVDYTYTGISGKTFTGVTPDPTSGANTVYAGDIAVQKVVTTANSSFTAGPSATFANGLISTLTNQVFIGSLTSSAFYMSKINSYTDYSFSSGGRLAGDGATGTLDENLVAFIPQEENMYISCGKTFWYNTKLTQTIATIWNGTSQISVTYETFEVKLLKTNPRQGAQSQGLVGKMKNNVIMITNEPTFDMMGRVDQILGTPQTTNISDSIKLDFDQYDFTGGHVFYWKYNLLVSVPLSGLVLVYSLATKSWEVPQTIPITRFYTIDGELYGHSYVTSESYQLFTGYSDRATSTGGGSPYLVVANFSYQNFGTRTTLKNQNKFYIEGYISANTTLNCLINYEQDGNLTTQTFSILGDDTALIGGQDNSNSLGKNPLGNQPGGSIIPSSLTGLPPKFRVIKTFPRFDFYECQFSFSILGVDQNFQLLAFGTNASPSATQNYAIEE